MSIEDCYSIITRFTENLFSIISKKEQGKINFLDSYTAIYKIININDSNKKTSYENKLFHYFSEILIEQFKNVGNELAEYESEELILKFIELTNQCKTYAYWIIRMFSYLDKFYVKNNKCGTLSANALKLFIRHTFFPIKYKIYRVINKITDKNREDKVTDLTKIKEVVSLINEIDCKEPTLELNDNMISWKGSKYDNIKSEWFQNFTRLSESYLRKKTQKEISTLSVSDYIMFCLMFIEEEKERRAGLIDKIYYDKYDVVIINELVDTHKHNLINVSLI